MSRLGKIAAAAVLVVSAGALLVAPGAGAAPKSGTYVSRAQHFAFIFAKGSNGWHLQVATTLRPRRKNQEGTVALSGPHHQSVTYSVHEHTTADGGIEAKLPGVGRIAVRFEQTDERKSKYGGPGNCTSAGVAAERLGRFRGTIEIHGEGGLTSVESRSAHGYIDERPREVCRKVSRHRTSHHGAAEGNAGERFLLAGRPERGGEVNFRVWSFPSPLASVPSPAIYFATYSHSRAGMHIDAETMVEAEATSFKTSPSSGTLTEAVVEPPAPFTGTGTFKLEAPTKASWSGDLGVEIPTLGPVSLVGPEFWSSVCTGNVCTKTRPENLGFGAEEIQTIH